MPRPITFLSDFGVADEFAGVCRAVIARIAPEARIIDISHGVERHAISHGAAMLVNALPFAPAGVHMAVVDPGVGTERRALAVAVAQEDRILVGPDNGLLWPAIERFGGAVQAVDVTTSPVRLEPTSATFHGRDIFAPVTAHLASGMSLAQVGEPLDPAELVTLVTPAAVVDDGVLRTTVSYVDRYGNATLAADQGAADEAGLRAGAPLSVKTAGGNQRGVYAITFGEVAEGELLMYVAASGRLALAINQGNAAERLGIAAGDEVVLGPC